MADVNGSDTSIVDTSENEAFLKKFYERSIFPEQEDISFSSLCGDFHTEDLE